MKRYRIVLEMGHATELDAEWFEVSQNGVTFRVEDDDFVEGRLVAAFRGWDYVITLEE